VVDLQEIANGCGFLIVCSGDVAIRDIYEAKVDLKDRYPAIGSWYFAMIDLSNVAQLDVTAADFDRLVELDRRLSRFTRPGLPVAIIARGIFLLVCRACGSLSSDPTGWESRVFRERSVAEARTGDRVRSLFNFDIPAFRVDAPSSGSRA
jgi:hypothetical protein